MFRPSWQALVFLSSVLLGTGAQAEGLMEQVAKVCIEQNAAPSYIDFDSPELQEYCRCEAKIWAEHGTEVQLRSAMTLTTDDQAYMQGHAYSYDDALDFIVQHSGTVDAACAPS